MKNTDIALIHRTLNGDDNAFAELVKKISETGSRAGMAQNWRFPHR